ncbi:MAG: PEP-CTERM sorting domain-containing protein [Holophagae bacterium]|nr:MAG: PEP-CTERM sorting domain-containing protein [Holophagae bacterium]
MLLLAAAVPMWAGNDRDVVNPADPGSYTPPDPNSPTWAGPEAVLYDNGPLVTHPGGGAGGADASAVQTALVMGVYGFGHALSSGYRVADDFTVADSGGWDVQTITFFGYQTGSGTTSTINHVNLRIWNGDPSGSGTVVFGDTATNRLASTAWSNIYRVLDTGLTDTQRPIMADVVTVGTNLVAGTYWLDWQTGGTGASGPWAPPISILGQTTTGNALQWDGAVWNPLLDSGSATQQGLPFIVEGLVVPVELQSFDVE